MHSNSVCCIIVVYNIGEQLYNCFKSIHNQVDMVVLVDNGSDEETIKVLKKIDREDRVKVIYNNNNKGIAYALNRGVKFAEENNYEWVLTMDNDSNATPNMVETMLQTYNSLENNIAELVVSLFPTRIDKAISNCKDIVSERKANDYNFIKVDMTSGNLIKTRVFKEIGYFEEMLFIDSVDTDFCFRIIGEGYKMISLNNAYLLHSLGNITKKKILIKNITYTNHSALRRYYITRNRLYIWDKYKNIARYEILRDKYWNICEIIKIIFFENDKINKIKMVLKGISDYRINKFGKYNE